ncbi:hypothetical protein BBO99_00008149 [Phytophthora kernoviae]|uniref:Ysc84 actin-binding domain-containing protein n=2 Tax=Phytophthora kernoviae TaxID=325452 RepID=A0A3R7JSA5_9STRA|nr:hypothetical protein G195_010963 [Phytophthora kernoviae 00238/432]KAG2513594.1 hypothetical protein JM16_007902 [Phytophthora kernoviae]KAG2515928.1 hypothetical protein JM18_008024 [Phytophthora kernoviae]RLN06651.1 hypothetical protein BBI17_008114 [Phytophthora kernoviae]RLN75668.1 hypothetical protein BBO99_00008149 [Phytophthora kernoviae]
MPPSVNLVKFWSKFGNEYGRTVRHLSPNEVHPVRSLITTMPYKTVRKIKENGLVLIPTVALLVGTVNSEKERADWSSDHDAPIIRLPFQCKYRPQSSTSSSSAMMNSTYASSGHSPVFSKPGSVSSTSSSSRSSSLLSHPMRKPSTKALILQRKEQEEQHRATLARADTADDALLSHAGGTNQLPPQDAIAALRERSNSVAVMESMRSHLPGNGHAMTVKATAKLKKEMDNAAQVVESFLSPKLLKDQSIPHELLAEAYGLVFVTMYKVGFLFSGKIGTGFIISRTTGGWSAPSFLTSGGFGFGMMAGGEVVNYMIILNSRSAVKVFTRNGQVQLGSELDIAVGPIGRAASASLNVGAGGIAPNYSYSHSKGLYGGIGISSAIICTRKSLNAKCYGPNVTARQLLGGEVACPLAEPLWRALDKALGVQRDYANGFPVLAPTYTGMACDACGHIHTSVNNPSASGMIILAIPSVPAVYAMLIREGEAFNFETQTVHRRIYINVLALCSSSDITMIYIRSLYAQLKHRILFNLKGGVSIDCC